MEGLLDLSSNAMKYVVIEETLSDPLRKKWKDVERTKLQHYIVNINPERWVLCKARRAIDYIRDMH